MSGVQVQFILIQAFFHQFLLNSRNFLNSIFFAQIQDFSSKLKGNSKFPPSKWKDISLNSRISLLNSRFWKFCCSWCRKTGEKKPALHLEYVQSWVRADSSGVIGLEVSAEIQGLSNEALLQNTVINDMIKTDPELTGGEETDVGAGIVDSSSNIACLQDLEKISRLP